MKNLSNQDLILSNFLFCSLSWHSSSFRSVNFLNISFNFLVDWKTSSLSLPNFCTIFPVFNDLFQTYSAFILLCNIIEKALSPNSLRYCTFLSDGEVSRLQNSLFIIPSESSSFLLNHYHSSRIMSVCLQNKIPMKFNYLDKDH